ncbi:MAG: type I glutamate--ammonia ligase [Candidatus Altiarchaeota archaeon]|nr:type I glutamate--ammonia ligase [Candidatus Altiarchaeota archaeon]
MAKKKMGDKDKIMNVLNKAEEDGVKFVNLMFTDIMGGIKSVTITVEHLESSLTDGTWFDGSSIEGFARIHESDMILKPDPDTYAVLPWRPTEKAEARFIADVLTPEGTPFEGDPRYILKRAIAEAEKMGYGFYTGPELEFFLFKPENGKIVPVPHDVGGYFDYSARDLASDVRRDITIALEALGMRVEMSHHEVAAGQHEIDVRYSDALRSADNSITLKHTVKEIATLHGLYATFMPKPIYGINGSGMHTHQSLFKGNKNAFYDGSDKYHLSDLAYSYIAGILEHVREMSAVLAPTVNSYKRLVPGYEAPVYICWGQRNRSALVRVPRYSPGRDSAVRCEVRCPDPACNPYMAFATMLHAGLDGVRRKLKPPAPVEEDVYEFDDRKLKEKYIKTLPASLGEALEEMRKSEFVKKSLGDHTYGKFLEAKKQEYDEYRIAVTDWEIKRYLEVL